MGPTLSPETSAFKLQTPGKFPEEYKLHSEHGESLKTTIPAVNYQITVVLTQSANCTGSAVTAAKYLTSNVTLVIKLWKM